MSDVDVGGSTSRARPRGRKTPDGEPVYSVEDWSPVIEEIERARHPRADELDYIEASREDAILPPLDLPGFGDREPDCGEYIPEAMRWCSECGDVKQNKHNCLRYDCPDHAPYAVRRRAAGSSSGSGIGPQLGSLIRWLGAYYDEQFNYHHLTIEPPEDYYLESDRPLERLKEICREILDVLGMQGVLVYHPWKGDHEDPDEDDMGKWKTRLFHDRDWSGDVRDELKPKGHVHVIGVAPWVDLRGWDEVYEATGWVIKRFTKGGGGDDRNVSIKDEADMATKLTYALSHAGVYGTESGQRRLAAWLKGPDVNRVDVPDRVKLEVAPKIHAAAEDTLGIPAPSFTCERDVPVRLDRRRERPRELEDVERVSDRRREAGGPLASEPLGGWTGPSIATRTSSRPERIELASASGWGSSDPIRVSSVPATQACGGYVRHISTAGEALLSREWREQALFADDLESAYRSYVDVMTSKDLDPLEDGEPLIAEEIEPTTPPPDD